MPGSATVPPRPGRGLALGLTGLLHAGLIAVLLLVHGTPNGAGTDRVISVSLLAPSTGEAARRSRLDAPAIALSVPQPLARLPLLPAPILPPQAVAAAPAPIPAPIQVSASEIEPAAAGSTPPLPEEDNPKPRYPEIARRKRFEGTVTLEVSVSTAGAPTDVAVAESSGHDLLDDEAVWTVRRWRFRPARSHGRPEPGILRIPIVFELRQ